MCSAMLSFICTVGDNVMIRFPRKRCLFVSTTHAIRPRNRGMKSLEVQNILKSAASSKRNLGSTDEIYQADRHGYLLNVKKEILIHCPISVSVYQTSDRSMIYSQQPHVYSFGSSYHSLQSRSK
jgi:hypothetical protein